ncbi:MAG: competence/damage-inducible protein A [Firmicutes bacterium]|nr:competence/damage-inducible protein A [Bacillota bacterium]
MVSVGTELLLGQIANTNARFLAQCLAELGIDSYYQQVVGDNRVRLAEALRLALARSDLVITTGGLGPTEDDLTKETVAEVLGLELVSDPATAERIRGLLCAQRSRVAESAVAKQSLVLEGAEVFPNPVGTAPGLGVRAGGRVVVLLPGPPAELEAVVREHVVPWLERLLAAGGVWPASTRTGPRNFLCSRVVKVCGLGEPAVEEALGDLVRSANPTVAPLVTTGETHVRVTAAAGSKEEAGRLAGEMAELVASRLEPHVFGFDDETLPSACGKLLREGGLTLALAESLTGGLVGHLLTEVPGASDYFERGVVVYSNRSKTELCGVPDELLKAHGAVSEPVASAMARGIRERSGTDLGLALTGIAGPTGGTSTKPVGLVYIALAGPGGVRCERYVFAGGRSVVKLRAAQRALTLLWERLRLGVDTPTPEVARDGVSGGPAGPEGHHRG